MDATERTLHLLRLIARLCALAMLATILLSATMRLSQAGLGCADWPGCYGSAARDGAHVSSSDPSIAMARFAHRVVASAVLAGAFVMVLMTLSAPAAVRRARPAAVVLLALALALAALGIVTPGARLPAVVLGNLLGGFAMLALCIRLATVGQGRSPPGLGAWATAGLLLLVLQIGLGAQVSASLAALSCTDLGDCLRAAAAGDWQALYPFREPVFDATGALHRSAAPVLLLHRLGALLTLAAVVGLGVMAWRRGRRPGGATLLLLAAAQAVAGPAAIASNLALPVVLLHNLIAALLLATLLRLR